MHNYAPGSDTNFAPWNIEECLDCYGLGWTLDTEDKRVTCETCHGNGHLPKDFKYEREYEKDLDL